MRKMRNALLAVAMLSLLGACQPATKSQPDAAAEKAKADSIRTAEMAAEGATVFLQNCAMCHGNGGNGDGDVAPAILAKGARVARLNDPETMGRLTREQVLKVVHDGGAHTGRSNFMPSWADSLDPTQIANVVEYVMTLKSTNPAVPNATVQRYLAAPEGVSAEGRELFVRHCAACHGGAGKGDGPFAARLAAMATPVHPRNLTDSTYMNTRTDQQLYGVVSLGGGHFKKAVQMPAWTVTLSPEQIKTVVAYVRTLSRGAPAK
jgi:cbb3-type cytochrome c oxidase subunit III